MAISGVFEFPDLVPEELGTAANCCGWDWLLGILRPGLLPVGIRHRAVRLLRHLRLRLLELLGLELLLRLGLSRRLCRRR